MSRTESDVLSLDQFRDLPEFRPPLEFFEGRVVRKMSPKIPHGILQPELWARLNARPGKLGRAYTELRCTFGGGSFVFDVAYFAENRLPRSPRRAEPADVLTTPDLAIEILSPGQTVRDELAKLRFAIDHGMPMGWCLHPRREIAVVIRPGRPPRTLRSGNVLSGEAVLPGFALPVDELFGWLD